jgi:hypothetical protein
MSVFPILGLSGVINTWFFLVGKVAFSGGQAVDLNCKKELKKSGGHHFLAFLHSPNVYLLNISHLKLKIC